LASTKILHFSYGDKGETTMASIVLEFGLAYAKSLYFSITNLAFFLPL
jgi:hypothetical protein